MQHLPEKPPHLPAPPDLQRLYDWLQDLDVPALQWLGPAAHPTGLGAWYPTHLQTAELRSMHGLTWLVLQSTFCTRPQRGVAVQPLLAHANLQMEAGRWYRLLKPTRLACAYEVPAHLLDAEEFAAVWLRFRREVVQHGIELTLRTRSERWIDALAAKGVRPPAKPRGRKRRPRPAQTV